MTDPLTSLRQFRVFWVYVMEEQKKVDVVYEFYTILQEKYTLVLSLIRGHIRVPRASHYVTGGCVHRSFHSRPPVYGATEKLAPRSR